MSYVRCLSIIFIAGIAALIVPPLLAVVFTIDRAMESALVYSHPKEPRWCVRIDKDHSVTRVSAISVLGLDIEDFGVIPIPRWSAARTRPQNTDRDLAETAWGWPLRSHHWRRNGIYWDYEEVGRLHVSGVDIPIALFLPELFGNFTLYCAVLFLAMLICQVPVRIVHRRRSARRHPDTGISSETQNDARESSRSRPLVHRQMISLLCRSAASKRLCALSLVVGVIAAPLPVVLGYLTFDARVKDSLRTPATYNPLSHWHHRRPWINRSDDVLRLGETAATWGLVSSPATKGIMIVSHPPQWPDEGLRVEPGDETEKRINRLSPEAPQWMNDTLAIVDTTPDWWLKRDNDREIEDFEARPLPGWATGASLLRDGRVYIEGDAGERTDVHIWIVGYGWPLPWLRSLHLRDAHTHFSPVLEQGDADMQLNWQMLEGWQREGSMPWPGRILWLNLAINVLIAALPIWCVLMMFSFARKLDRTIAGRCPICAYDLRNNPTPGCPECGWGR